MFATRTKARTAIFYIVQDFYDYGFEAAAEAVRRLEPAIELAELADRTISDVRSAIENTRTIEIHVGQTALDAGPAADETLGTLASWLMEPLVQSVGLQLAASIEPIVGQWRAVCSKMFAEQLVPLKSLNLDFITKR